MAYFSSSYDMKVNILPKYFFYLKKKEKGD